VRGERCYYERVGGICGGDVSAKVIRTRINSQSLFWAPVAPSAALPAFPIDNLSYNACGEPGGLVVKKTEVA